MLSRRYPVNLGRYGSALLCAALAAVAMRLTAGAQTPQPSSLTLSLPSVDSVQGSASITDAHSTRPLHKGDVIVPPATVVVAPGSSFMFAAATAQNAIRIKMPDGAFVAMVDDSKLKIETYRSVTPTGADLTLVSGGFRIDSSMSPAAQASEYRIATPFHGFVTFHSEIAMLQALPNEDIVRCVTCKTKGSIMIRYAGHDFALPEGKEVSMNPGRGLALIENRFDQNFAALGRLPWYDLRKGEIRG